MLLRMQKEYWSRVHERAFTATRKFLGLESWGQIMLRALSAIAIISGLVLWGSDDAARDELIFRGAAIGMVLMLFPVVYAWHFARTPAQIDAEQQHKTTSALTEIENLTTEMADRKATGDRVKILGIILFEGEALRIKRITEEQFPDWKEDIRIWGLATVKFLATSFSQQDATRFNFAHYYPNNAFSYKINDEHNKILNEYSVRLEFLKSILDRYQESWAPISVTERQRLENVLTTIKVKIVAPDGDQTLKKENG